MSGNKVGDKNSIIGLALIAVILLVFSLMNSNDEAKKPGTKDKPKTEKQVNKTNKEEVVSAHSEDTLSIKDTSAIAQINPEDSLNTDSLKNNILKEKFGTFYKNATGEKKYFILENEELKVNFSNKGARITSVELKKYHTYKKTPLILFIEDSSKFNMTYFVSGIGDVNTQDFYFEAQPANNKIDFSIKSEKGEEIIFHYALNEASPNLVDFNIEIKGFNKTLPQETPFNLEWSMTTPSQEKTVKNQQMVSTVFWKYHEGDVDYINENKYEEQLLEADVEWVMFKQQYFNSTLIATDKPFDNIDGKVATSKVENSEDFVQGMKAHLAIPFSKLNHDRFPMQFYFGPNEYSLLKTIGHDLQRSINYGWGIFRWVNLGLIRPLFKFFYNNTNLSVGIIILILTVIIKLLLFPITWKTYLGTAKMRVLKPEIQEIQEKYKDDAMKKQQATMALYRQTGVNPLSGCIPLLIQMPILFALFRFFPATFDLRQKSFLWAEDLSTYDSIMELPFNIPFYGSHVSLFTLLMAISMIFYTKVNNQMTSGAGMEGAMASQMKIMTWLMPIMMLFFFNSYAAGLSYYYLIANMITIFQQFAIRKWIVDEDKVRAKIEAYKVSNKSKKKKSGFASRLEQRLKEQQELRAKQQKKK
ncbi:MAG: membrane protein insertase YidC [Vicingaceae bacterium]